MSQASGGDWRSNRDLSQSSSPLALAEFGLTVETGSSAIMSSDVSLIGVAKAVEIGAVAATFGD
jgi:hypothetical protein